MQGHPLTPIDELLSEVPLQYTNAVHDEQYRLLAPLPASPRDIKYETPLRKFASSAMQVLTQRLNTEKKFDRFNITFEANPISLNKEFYLSSNIVFANLPRFGGFGFGTDCCLYIRNLLGCKCPVLIGEAKRDSYDWQSGLKQLILYMLICQRSISIAEREPANAEHVLHGFLVTPDAGYILVLRINSWIDIKWIDIKSITKYDFMRPVQMQVFFC